MAKTLIHVSHGGSDPGAIGATGLKEKDVALIVSKKVRDILVKHNQIIKLSRETDISQKSWVAADMANAWGADYVVSIHCNSASNPAATGTETFAHSPTSKGNAFAQSVQRNLVGEIKLPDRGVKYNNNFAILAKPKAPAILVEIAFINNPVEEALLRDDKFLDKVAIGISKGILEHLGVRYVGQFQPTQPPILKPTPSIPSSTVKVRFKGKNIQVDGIFQDDKNYVSIRDLLEKMDYQVDWEQATQTVVIR